MAIASANPETRGGLILTIRRSSASFRCPERSCRLDVAQGVDTLVEADRRPQLAGDLAVQHDVVVEEWLLDE